MVTQAIVSLAILKVNWDRLGRDYLENFVPFVAECVRVAPNQVVSLPRLQQQLRRRFGLRLPQNSIRTVLKRVSKQGYVYSEDGVYKRNEQKLTELKFHEVQQQVLERHDALIRELILFCQDEFDVKLSTQEAEAALEAYLEDNQVAIAVAVNEGSLILPEESSTATGRFLVGSFIRHLQETHAASFRYVETVAKGNMLANALFLTRVGEHERKFRNTSIYFDTSFLIYALGYAGEARKQPCTELLDLTYETGAKLRCFQHTLDEVRGALDACMYRIAQGRLSDAYGPSIEYFLDKGYSASDVELLTARLPRDLKSLRIRVVDKPPYKPYTHVIDEEELAEVLERELNYTNEQAIYGYYPKNLYQ